MLAQGNNWMVYIINLRSLDLVCPHLTSQENRSERSKKLSDI